MKKNVLLTALLALAAALVMSACAAAPEETAPPPTEQPTEEPAPTDAPADSESDGEPAEEDAPLVLEDDKLYLALVWHQHQPVYFKDPATGVYERPWVRVHATKDYLDMATILEDYPNVHVTFNITPSLIQQLNDLESGTKDLYWVLAEVPAEDLTEGEKRFILERFFDINPTIIARFPRYVELADSRNELGIDAALTEWSDADFRDLQVLFNLGWTDPDFLAEEPLASLVAKERGYSEEDKAVIFAEHLRIIGEVLPYHAQLQEQGQIEVTMTPFAHPILPLLVDSNLAQTALPDAELPTRFVWGQDAVAHVEMGVALYEETFGVAPRGMWPAEGSVAEEVVSMIASAGIEWIATDEEVLAGSIPQVEDFTRNSEDTVQQADVLYRPYEVQGPRGGPVAIIFRDKTISDKIGFEYSGTPGTEAAADLMTRLTNIKAQLEEEGAEGPNLVTILLDGENAWEHYPNDGKEFLHEMYRLLNESEDIVTVTPSEYLDALDAAGEEPTEIEELFPGSWIDGTYSTWIGEEEENQAWEYLLRTREDLRDAINSGELDEDTVEEAMALMYAAEGSDWFWWYGSDQNSGDDGEFDRQFRAYLEQIYLTIGEEVPSFVYVPVIPLLAQQPDQQPTDLLAVSVDGQVSEGEWDTAGVYTLDQAGLSGFNYGFDQETLYLGVLGEGFSDDTTLGFYVNLPQGGASNAYSRYGEGETTFGFGAQRLLEVTFEGGQPSVAVYQADGASGWELVESEVAITAALGDGVLEIGAPFASFNPDARSGDRLNVRLVVTEGESDVAVAPSEGPALMAVPDLPIPNVFLNVEDPLDDDHGPGTYTYAEDVVFTGGSFDMTNFSVGYDDELVIMRVQLDGPVDNVWGSPNGLSIQTIDVYIDVDGPETGARTLLPGRNAALTADFGWDYAIWAEGWTPGIFTPGEEGPVEVTNEFGIVTNPGQRRVTISVPRTILEGSPEEWSFAVVIGGQEGFPSAGVWRLRDVDPTASQWRFGGSPGDTNATRLMDILVAAGADVPQEDLLGGYPPSSDSVDALEPDDFPQVTMVSAE